MFPQEQLARVQGSILQCQLLESALLNNLNFLTLIATRAARVCRAAYVGGCVGTSNALAGKVWGIPVKGMHGHSRVMSFDTELESFTAYAKALPNNGVFLVDTYDTLHGVRNDFVLGGALPVPEVDTIVPLLNPSQEHFDLVVATQDWHPANYGSFAASQAVAEMQIADVAALNHQPRNSSEHGTGETNFVCRKTPSPGPSRALGICRTPERERDCGHCYDDG